MHKFITRYLNSTAVFSPPDDATLAQRQREEIQITASTHENENQNDNQNGNQSQDTGDENENDENKDEDTESGNDEDVENKDEETNENETEEQKEKRLDKEREERKAARQQRKWDKLAAEKTAAEKRVKELEAQLAEKPNEGLSEEEVERRAEEKANQKLQEQQARQARKLFEDNCDALEAEASKAAKLPVEKFRSKLGELVQDIGPIPPRMVEVLADLDNKNGGKVLNYLIDNIDEAEELYALSDIRMAQRIVRISDKIKEAEKPKPRQRSNTPPPISPINESGRKDITQITDNMDMETFVRIRNKQVEERNKAKGRY